LHLGRSYYAQALEFSGRTDEALAEYRLARTLAPDLPWLAALEAACLARRGDVAAAAGIREELEATRKVNYVDAYYLAPRLHALGKHQEAFRELERAYAEGSTALYMLDVDPRMDALRSDPRFERIRKAVLAG
jgi:tetratricopeptide (TPR) repeat protein